MPAQQTSFISQQPEDKKVVLSTRISLAQLESHLWEAANILRYILDPQDVYGPDFPGETFRVLKEKEIRQFGEYRTRRLVLEAWDRLGERGDAVGGSQLASESEQLSVIREEGQGRVSSYQ